MRVGRTVRPKISARNPRVLAFGSRPLLEPYQDFMISEQNTLASSLSQFKVYWCVFDSEGRVPPTLLKVNYRMMRCLRRELAFTKCGSIVTDFKPSGSWYLYRNYLIRDEITPCWPRKAK